MIQDISKSLDRLKQQLNQAVAKIGLTDLVRRREDLLSQIAKPDFWQNSSNATQVSKAEASLGRRIEPWQKLQKATDELAELVAVGDKGMSSELQEQLSTLNSRFLNLKSQLRFRGPYDEREVILSIYAGAGGTDAQDWAQILLRMYTRYADSQRLKVKIIAESPGEEAGLKSVSIELSGGEFLYGKLAGEHGVHRLVRLSPFNADNLRQTSFAKVEILPLIEAPGDLQVDEKDLKIDVFRSAGAGGQSVNTTDSAVRVTHLPTGVTVAIQNERSQLQNKETALAVLRSKLIALQLEQHAKSLALVKGPSQSAEWGNQIRSYVLHPYKQVKDLRTGYESSDPDKVLNGDLEPFIEAWLEDTSG